MPFTDDQAKFERFLESKLLPPNDSGQGDDSRLPESLRGLNWGAFLLNLAWGIAMKTPWAWLCLVPLVGTFWPLVMLFRGNEWAWKSRKWESEEHFRKVQNKWTTWGVILTVVFLVLSFYLASWFTRTMMEVIAPEFKV
jgi:hypothetical protein